MPSKGQILRLLRQSLGYTQEYVADRATITVTFLSLIENGKKAPSDETLEKLSEVYKVPPYLFSWNETGVKQTANAEERKLLSRIDEFVELLFEQITKRNNEEAKT